MDLEIELESGSKNEFQWMRNMAIGKIHANKILNRKGVLGILRSIWAEDVAHGIRESKEIEASHDEEEISSPLKLVDKVDGKLQKSSDLSLALQADLENIKNKAEKEVGLLKHLLLIT
ncbi:Alanyl-tRNA synthetase [Corchorus olitorius]|uniref:Alanyl-tRNA synthetase n=1 Tax=Corchorus olitorius TaxID=93759 RepID=A0A1R3JNP5_9ROSI|nr:Alanyl-tRNA synthetase [Corchorus olitorius]